MRAFKNENGELVKTCTRCNRTLPIDKFGIKKSQPDGHYPCCKECRSKERRDYKNGVKHASNKQNSWSDFLTLLPKRFTKPQFMEAGDVVGLTKATLNNYFSLFLRKGIISHVDGAFYTSRVEQTSVETNKAIISEEPKKDLDFKENRKDPEETSATAVKAPKTLAGYTELELMAELYRRGYIKGWEHLTHVQVIENHVSPDAVKDAVAQLRY